MSLYAVQGSPTKTDWQVVNKSDSAVPEIFWDKNRQSQLVTDFWIKSYIGYMAIHIRWNNPTSLRNSIMQASGSSQRGSSMSQLCRTHHEFVATLYIPGVCVQWSEPGHNVGKPSVVLWTRYGILWLWYGQFGVGLSQPLSSGQVPKSLGWS